jgi:hypothetical protein
MCRGTRLAGSGRGRRSATCAATLRARCCLRRLAGTGVPRNSSAANRRGADHVDGVPPDDLPADDLAAGLTPAGQALLGSCGTVGRLADAACATRCSAEHFRGDRSSLTPDDSLHLGGHIAHGLSARAGGRDMAGRHFGFRGTPCRRSPTGAPPTAPAQGDADQPDLCAWWPDEVPRSTSPATHRSNHRGGVRAGRPPQQPHLTNAMLTAGHLRAASQTRFRGTPHRRSRTGAAASLGGAHRRHVFGISRRGGTPWRR